MGETFNFANSSDPSMLRRHQEASEDQKKKLLENLRDLYKTNPEFAASAKSIEQTMKEKPELFLDITNVQRLLRFLTADNLSELRAILKLT